MASVYFFNGAVNNISVMIFIITLQFSQEIRLMCGSIDFIFSLALLIQKAHLLLISSAYSAK